MRWVFVGTSHGSGLDFKELFDYNFLKLFFVLKIRRAIFFIFMKNTKNNKLR